MPRFFQHHSKRRMTFVCVLGAGAGVEATRAVETSGSNGLKQPLVAAAARASASSAIVRLMGGSSRRSRGRRLQAAPAERPVVRVRGVHADQRIEAVLPADDE